MGTAFIQKLFIIKWRSQTHLRQAIYTCIYLYSCTWYWYCHDFIKYYMLEYYNVWIDVKLAYILKCIRCGGLLQKSGKDLICITIKSHRCQCLGKLQRQTEAISAIYLEASFYIPYFFSFRYYPVLLTTLLSIHDRRVVRSIIMKRFDLNGNQYWPSSVITTIWNYNSANETIVSPYYLVIIDRLVFLRIADVSSSRRTVGIVI